MTQNQLLQDIIASVQEENARLALVMARRPRPQSLVEQHETESMRQRIASNHDIMRSCRDRLRRH